MYYVIAIGSLPDIYIYIYIYMWPEGKSVYIRQSTSAHG